MQRDWRLHVKLHKSFTQLLSCSDVIFLKSVPLGKNCLSSLFVFSSVALSQGLCGGRNIPALTVLRLCACVRRILCRCQRVLSDTAGRSSVLIRLRLYLPILCCLVLPQPGNGIFCPPMSISPQCHVYTGPHNGDQYRASKGPAVH